MEVKGRLDECTADNDKQDEEYENNSCAGPQSSESASSFFDNSAHVQFPFLIKKMIYTMYGMTIAGNVLGRMYRLSKENSILLL
ncbi:hypothetical protein GCM10010913_09220 [Paenibacillus aceti]|uniref:Uncharacterized protein n=1 Tax=Paenibacillus aceti TaxID=1820010 RepID=A0ABQ1VQN4_9BACL|nr:hypothetical protein GCM10010913_09220 [Paenibacillus aceti]